MWQIRNKTQFELLRLSMKSSQSAIIGQVAVLAIVAHRFFGYVSDVKLLLWIVVHLFLYLLRFYLSRVLLSLRNSEENFVQATRLTHLYTLLLFFTSLAWAGGVLFLSYLPVYYHYLLYMIVVGFTFAAVISIGSILPMFFAFSIPMNLVMAYFIVMHSLDNRYYDLLIFMVVVFVFAIKAAKHSKKVDTLLIEEKHNVKDRLAQVVSDHKRKSFYLEAIDKIGVAMIVLDAYNKIIEANSTAIKLFGEIVGKEFSALSKQLRKVQKNSYSSEYIDAKTQKRYEVFSQKLDTADGEKAEVLFFSDITQEHTHQEALEKMAHRYYQKARLDPLTKVFNREALFDSLEQALYEADREFTKVALVFLDIDNFKQINDLYGHKIGDAVLQIASKRMVGSIKQSDIVGRYAGDEFVVILKGIEERRGVQRVVEKLLAVLSEPFAIEGAENVTISVSIGVAIYPDDTTQIDKLVHYADEAMYRIKNGEKNGYTFYNGDSDAKSV